MGIKREFMAGGASVSSKQPLQLFRVKIDLPENGSQRASVQFSMGGNNGLSEGFIPS